METGRGRRVLSRVELLVVGGGPVGLALALQARQHGVEVLVVERRDPLPRPSRAMLLWPRTLAALDRLGVAARLAAWAVPELPVRVHLGRREVRVGLGDLVVPGLSRPPLMVPQALLEAALLEEVQRHDIPVRTGTSIVGLHHEAGGAVATLDGRGAEDQVACRFLVGCDGAGSAVRALAGFSWRGRTYRQEAVLADLDMVDPPRTAAHVGAGPAGVGFLFPAGEHGAPWRLVATRAATSPDVGAGRDGPPLSLPEIRGVLHGANLPGRLRDVSWSTRVRLQRRLAGRYRDGAVLLAGDAAHVFSPAGAQGVNTGLQDATNLGWKLGAALRGAPGAEELLGSYGTERRPVARRVSALTDLLLRGEGDDRAPFRLLRTYLLPGAAPLVPLALRARAPAALAARVLAQDWVRYAVSPVVVGPARAVSGFRAGAFAPDRKLVVDGRPVAVQDLTAPAGVHLLHGELEGVPQRRWVTAHLVEGWPAGRVVAIRPDGYVGLVGHVAGATESADLLRWLRTVTGAAPAR